jgi:peptidoglycan/xylan/chitin deacetylase (PgdA/CDA1 family)
MDKLQIFARCLDQVAGQRVNRLARWSGLLAFNYHRIGDAGGSPFDRELLSATAEGFEEQMSFLARHFDVVGLDDLAGLSDAPKGRKVLVTFDDGYRDNYEFAYPILRAKGLKAAFFITTGFLDEGGLAWWDEIAWMVRNSKVARLPAREWLSAELSMAKPDQDEAICRLLRLYKSLPGARCDEYVEWLGEQTGSGRCSSAEACATWMTWDMVREMRAGGMSIGGHTVNHPILARLEADEQVREIQGTVERIRAELGEPMRWFAYPVGGRDTFNDDTRRALRQAGVELAFSYYGGYRRPGDWDPLDVRRVPVEASFDGARFRAIACLPSLFSSPHASRWVRRLRETIRDAYRAHTASAIHASAQRTDFSPSIHSRG